MDKSNTSEFFSTRITTYLRLNGSYNWFISQITKFRTALTYDYLNSKNILSETGEKAPAKPGLY